MTSSSVVTVKSEFDAFLFSPIGEDKNGIELKILSLLARQKLDPWEEAAKLAALPRNAARTSLTSLISQASFEFSSPPDPEALVNRIIDLLPDRAIRAYSWNGMQPLFRATDATSIFAGFVIVLMVLVSIAYAPQAKHLMRAPKSAASTVSSAP